MQLRHDDALTELFRSEYGRLLRTATFLLGDAETAEDVVQEAFVAVHVAHSGNGEQRDLRLYLRAVVVNKSRSAIRRRAVARRHRPTELLYAPNGPMPDDRRVSQDHADSRLRVLEAIARLSLRQRECIVLRYYDDLSERDIAQTLGVSVGSVKRHLFRAMKTLTRPLEALNDPT